MTAFGELETAVEAMSAGAFWFVKKPFQNEELLALVARALESHKLWLELKRLRRTAFADEDYLHSMSPSMQEAYAIAEQVARGDTTSVLIEGESGTGKEYFANLIHHMSARHDRPFVEINCAAIPSELLESELFGHEKGAFTDARMQKPGLLELADGGTLFLDEIGEMNPMLQVKLLRVLERRTFKRVGGMSSRRCASGARTSCRWRACSWSALRVSSRSRSAPSRPRRSACCSSIRGPATSASCAICSSAPCCWRPARPWSRTT